MPYLTEQIPVCLPIYPPPFGKPGLRFFTLAR
jgi:hypothetical protein